MQFRAQFLLLASALLTSAFATSDGISLKLQRHLQNATVAKRSTEVTADIQHPSFYWTTEFEFGTPGQKANLLIDTGSMAILLYGSKYDPAKSSSKVDLKFEREARYTSGSLTSHIYKDIVKIGDAVVKNPALGRIVRGDLKFASGVDGIFGVGLADDVFGTGPSFTKAAKDQHVFDKNVWQLTLRDNGPSTLNIGKIDETEFEGQLGYTGITPGRVGWHTHIDVNGKRVSATLDSGGAYYIWGNRDEVRAIVNRLGKQHQYRGQDDRETWFKCDDLPKITFKVAGKEITLSERLMTREHDNEGWCKLPIIQVNGARDWNFADPFFQSTSLVFDIDNQRIGIALQK